MKPVDQTAAAIPTLKNESLKIFGIAVIIFLIALAVRYIGLKFDLPYYTHPDEIYIMSPLRTMSLNRTLDPGTYGYPAFPSFYSRYLVLNLISHIKFGMNYGEVYWRDPSLFYLASRFITAIHGALIPVVAWFIGRKFKQVNFSWVAAVLFTFYPAYILHSHYVTVDIPLTLHVMLVLLFCLEYLSTKRSCWSVLASVFVAVAALEKYPGILSAGIVLTAIAIRAISKDEKNNRLGWRFFIKTISLNLGVTLIAAVIIAPWLFINFDFAWKQILVEARPEHLGADGLGWGGNLFFYLKDFYSNSGLIISGFAVVGLIVTILMKDPVFLLLFFGGGYWIVMSKLSLHWTRWSLPMMTTPLFLAAIGLAFLWQKTKHKQLARVALATMVLAGLVPFVLKGMVTSVMLTWPDTRGAGLHYLQEHNMSEKNTLSEGYTPYNPNNVVELFKVDLSDPMGKEHIILSSSMYDRYLAEPDRYPAENEFYNRVRNQLELKKEFRPHPEPTSVPGQMEVLIEYLDRQLNGSEARFLKGPIIEIYTLTE